MSCLYALSLKGFTVFSISCNLSSFVFNSVRFILKPPNKCSLSYFYTYTSAINQFGKNRYKSGMNTPNKIIPIVITKIGITLTKRSEERREGKECNYRYRTE